MTLPSSKISVVVPTYNERENVAALLGTLVPALEGRDHEIVFVDDNSPDGTADAVREAARCNPCIRLVVRRGERGLAGAVIRGFNEASGGILGSLNADLSHDASVIPAMIEEIEAGAEMVVASRRIPGGGFRQWTWYRRLASDVATSLAKSALEVPLSDPMSGFYFLRRAVFERARDELQTAGFKVMLNLVVAANPSPLREVPYWFKDRQRGSSKVSLGVAVEYVRMLWRLRRKLRSRAAAGAASVGASLPRP